MKKQNELKKRVGCKALGGFLLGCFFHLQSFASPTETLPEGIRSPSLRRGWVTGIDQRYTSGGALWNVGDSKAVVFNADNLSKFNQRARQLVDSLNRFGNQELGSNINFGVLTPQTKPQVDYWAPVFAYGVNASWTLGFGVPVVHYTNQIELKIEGSNLDYYRTQFSGLSAELDQAFQTDLVYETHQTLRQKGYKPLENRDQTYLGDVQIASLYKFYERKNRSALYSLTLTLPTGPAYDPDDLMALNVFGRTSLENKAIFGWKFANDWEIAPYAAYTFFLPDKVNVRVPTDEEDVLPNEDTKENVDRRLGSVGTLGSELYYTLTDKWSFRGGYAIAEKARDIYAGSQAKRYDLLSRSTDSQSHTVSVGVSYSTVKSYFKKVSFLPAIFSLNLSDTIAGRNTERKTFQEMVFMMFF